MLDQELLEQMQPYRGMMVDFYLHADAIPVAAVIAVQPDDGSLLCQLRIFDADVSGHKTVPSATLPHRSKAEEGQPFWDYTESLSLLSSALEAMCTAVVAKINGAKDAAIQAIKDAAVGAGEEAVIVVTDAAKNAIAGLEKAIKNTPIGKPVAQAKKAVPDPNKKASTTKTKKEKAGTAVAK